jgi:hypothetical protein
MQLLRLSLEAPRSRAKRNARLAGKLVRRKSVAEAKKSGVDRRTF